MSNCVFQNILWVSLSRGFTSLYFMLTRVFSFKIDVVQDVAQCALHYKTNLCATNPIPAMAHQCAAWESCMNRDPSKVGRAKVGAETIAEVINSFVEPISWKTLVRVSHP